MVTFFLPHSRNIPLQINMRFNVDTLQPLRAVMSDKCLRSLTAGFLAKKTLSLEQHPGETISQCEEFQVFEFQVVRTGCWCFYLTSDDTLSALFAWLQLTPFNYRLEMHRQDQDQDQDQIKSQVRFGLKENIRVL